MNVMKILVALFSIVCLYSCCTFPYYIKEENIKSELPSALHSVDNEFCILIGGNPSFLTTCVFYQLVDVDSAFLNPNNIKVYHRKKCLKFKTKVYKQNKWTDLKTEILNRESLLRLDFKSKLCDRDTIVIVEQNFPKTGDSLVTTIITCPLDQARRTCQNSRIEKIITGVGCPLDDPFHSKRVDAKNERYDTEEEKRVIEGSEAKTAIFHGETIRKDHRGKTFETDSPISVEEKKL